MVGRGDLGVRLGRSLVAGDLLVLTGPLGAGKTTLTRGIGEGLGVRGPVTSPTFVLARTHPNLVLESRRHWSGVALDVATPSGRHEELVFGGAAGQAIAVAAREPVFDVHTLPGLGPDERHELGVALEGSGLFRRLWQ